MFKLIDLKYVFRGLKNRKFNFLISLMSLTAGFIGVFLLVHFIRFELSFDTFHQESNQLYRVNGSLSDGSAKEIAVTNASLKSFLKTEVSEITHVTHLIPLNYGASIGLEEGLFFELRGLYVENDFNEVFDFEILAGDEQRTFLSPKSIAITRKLAIKFFDSIDVIGKTLKVNDGYGIQQLEITAVYENTPANSHLAFDYLIGNKAFYDWEYYVQNNFSSFYTYVRTNQVLSDADQQLISERIADYNSQQSGKEISYQFQPIEDIHFNDQVLYDYGTKTNRNQIWILLIFCLGITFIMYFNFTLDTFSQIANRQKDSHIRSILGGDKTTIAIYTFENFFKITCSFLLGLLLLHLAGEYIGTDASYSFLNIELSKTILILLILLGFLISYLIAYISAKTVNLKISESKTGSKKLWRSIFISVQLCVVLTFMTVSLIINSQLNYLKTAELGYESEGVLVIDSSPGMDNELFERFIKNLNNNPYIKEHSVSLSFFYNDFRSVSIKADQQEYDLKWNMVSDGYFDVLEAEILSGRSFRDLKDTVSVVVNQKAAELIGYQNLASKSIEGSFFAYENQKFKIIGIVKNISSQSLSKVAEPIIYTLIPFEDFIGQVLIKYDEDSRENMLVSLKENWDQSELGTALEYDFLTNRFLNKLGDITTLGNMMNLFTVISFLISFLGLAGVVNENMARKLKEIVIKRVLGANALTVFSDVNKQILISSVLSIILFIPLSLYLSGVWLANFSYRIELSAIYFIIPVIVILSVLMVLSLHATYLVLSKKISNILHNE